jgi:hypothetical protein
MTIGVTTLLGLVLALWVKSAFGPAASLFALALLVFDPNILAQGRYTKTGLLLTLTCFLACVAWARYLDKPGTKRLILAGIAFGLAISTKYPALFLAPVFPLLALLHGWGRGAVRWKQGLFASGAVLAMGALALLLLYAPDAGALLPWRPAAAQEVPLSAVVNKSTSLGQALAWAGDRMGWRRHMLLVGLSEMAAYVDRGQEAYLLGRHSKQGWWYFYPVAFVVKTPVASLLLLALAAVWAVRQAARRRLWIVANLRRVPFAVWVMAVPLVVHTVVCLTSRVNTGLRHLLPSYPFLFALAGAAVSRIPWRPLPVALVCTAAVETLSVYPHFTAFFNRAVGGPAQGPLYLTDSSLDWGQDLKKLKAWHDGHDRPPLCLEYFGTAPPEFYGLRWRAVPMNRPTADWSRLNCYAAVSATILYGTYADSPGAARLRRMEPVARIGYSIYVYDLLSTQTAAPVRPAKTGPRAGKYATVGPYDGESPLIEYEGAWAHDRTWSNAFGGTLAYTDFPGDEADFWFEGRAIDLVFTRAPNRGIAGLSIDGGPEAELDQYAPAIQWQARWNSGPLPRGRHHVRLRVLPRSNPASTGYFVDLDAFVVR